MTHLPPLTASLVGILRGGSRKGAGLAADTGGAKTNRHTVTLDAASSEKMREIGAGNLSRGIREAARRLAPNTNLTRAGTPASEGDAGSASR